MPGAGDQPAPSTSCCSAPRWSGWEGPFQDPWQSCWCGCCSRRRCGGATAMGNCRAFWYRCPKDQSCQADPELWKILFKQQTMVTEGVPSKKDHPGSAKKLKKKKPVENSKEIKIEFFERNHYLCCSKILNRWDFVSWTKTKIKSISIQFLFKRKKEKRKRRKIMTEDEPRRSISLSFKAFTNCDERAITSAVNFIVTLKDSKLDLGYSKKKKKEKKERKKRNERKRWDLATAKLFKNPKSQDLVKPEVLVSLCEDPQEWERRNGRKKIGRKKKKRKKELEKNFFSSFFHHSNFKVI